jgi:hypothetical protein
MPETESIALGPALRELPLPSPPRDGWPSVIARLQRRRRQRRRALGLALAASLLLAALLPLTLGPPGTPAPDAEQQLRQLQQHSATLEALLAWAGPTWVDNGDSALLDHQLAVQLQWIDLQLAELHPGERAQLAGVELPLWTARVALLSQRAALAQARTLHTDGAHDAASRILLTL